MPFLNLASLASILNRARVRRARFTMDKTMDLTITDKVI